MRVFLSLLYGVTLAAHLPVALVLRRGLAMLGVSLPAALLVGSAILLAVPFHWRLQLALRDRPISAARRLLVEEPYFVHWTATLLALPLAVLAALGTALGGWPAGDPLLSWATAETLYSRCYLVGLAFAIWGVCLRRRRVRVVTVQVWLEGLGAAFDGYRIAQLSDLHVGSLCPPAWTRRWVSQVNELDVDAVALTGDYVSSGTRFHQAIASALGDLRAADGVYAVMGNHDYYGDGEPLMTLLRGRDIVLLRNEHLTIERDGDRLCLAGIDDRFTRRTDIETALAGRDPEQPLLVLAHDPQSFVDLAERGAALVLCGHTHWGQLGVPWLASRLNYARLWQPYCGGSYRRGDSQLYVSPGLGTTGPPVRIGTWPEITVLKLRAGRPSTAP
jgi:predicted MPP superfamily phosphohydrolase